MNAGHFSSSHAEGWLKKVPNVLPCVERAGGAKVSETPFSHFVTRPLRSP